MNAGIDKLGFERKFIYALQHSVTKRIYVGSTKNIEQRISTHMAQALSGNHPSWNLNEDVKKYGPNFKFYILDICDADKSTEYEWMLKYMTIDPLLGYNVNDAVCKTKYRKSISNFEFIEGEPDELPKISDEDLRTQAIRIFADDIDECLL